MIRRAIGPYLGALSLFLLPLAAPAQESERPAPRPEVGFVDADNDGVNDRFTDADGDGVNDIDGRASDEDADGIPDNVVDADGDGRNDITGLRYSHRTLMGGRFGRIDESRHHRPPFIDEDGDGLPDRRPADRFIDADGDGISDDRRLLPADRRRAMERLRQRRAPPKRRPDDRRPPPRGGR